MGGADSEPRLAAVDQIEIDELLERLLQRRGRVIAGVVRPQRVRVADMRQRIGSEEADDAVGDRRPIGQFLVEPGKRSAKFQVGFCSIRFQNSRKRGSRLSISLPAIRLALIAPIEVPMIQSGSTPASCTA